MGGWMNTDRQINGKRSITCEGIPNRMTADFSVTPSSPEENDFHIPKRIKNANQGYYPWAGEMAQ